MTSRLISGFCALALAATAPHATLAQDVPPLDERTAQTDLPLDGPRAHMELPHVALNIAVDPDARTIAGEGTYTVRAAQTLSSLAFDLDPRFAIDGVSVNGADLEPADFASVKSQLRIRLPRALEAGERAEVVVRWNGAPHVASNPPWDGGFTWSETPTGEPWIATTVQGEGCDLFWPCIDHSSKRIETLDMAVTVPHGLVAAGNGRLTRTTNNGDTSTFHWRARDPNTYGISLQIGPYELAEQAYRSRFGNEIPLMFWHLPGNGEEATRLLGELASALDFFEERIGPYPFGDEKAGIVETPHLGMEHQTINAYGNEFRRDALGYDWLLHHEFAHEWFANQLTNADIRHMWLHEGIGTWMQPLYLGWARGEMLYDAEMWRNRQQIRSRVPLVPPEDELPDYGDQSAGWGHDIYYKGAWVMHTLNYLVGEDVLFPALTRLTYGIDNPQPGEIRPVSRTTEDFRAILEEVGGEELDWFFDVYFYHAELPRLVTTQSGAIVELRWETPSHLAFEMPLEVRVGDEVRTVEMAGGTGRLELPDAHASWLVDPRNQVLKHDEAIAATQAF